MTDFFHRLMDFVLPRRCVCCGQVLTVSEDVVCAICMMQLPYTYFWRNPLDNPMAKEFWLKLPIEYAGALYYYNIASHTTRIVKALKYHGRTDAGELMGRLLAEKYLPTGMFNAVDVIMPVPLAKKRLKQRGYNQSMVVAKAISQLTGVKADDTAVARQTFEKSQTHLGFYDRQRNVDGLFVVKKPEKVAGKHVLLIDDVVTTGATTVACGKALVAAGAVKISVLSICFTKSL